MAWLVTQMMGTTKPNTTGRLSACDLELHVQGQWPKSSWNERQTRGGRHCGDQSVFRTGLGDLYADRQYQASVLFTPQPSILTLLVVGLLGLMIVSHKKLGI